MNKRAILIAGLVCFICINLQAQHTGNNRGLKDYYRNYFTMGVSVSPHSLQTADTTIILNEFSSLTPENAMKMEPVHPQQFVYHWQDADLIVAFAQRHHLKVRGHTLCWYNQAPAWIFTDNQGHTVSKDTLLQRLKEHITTVVNRYKGRVYAWDVVNEAVSDKPDEYLRPCKWLEIIGEDYIAKAFEYAHAADPDALLFYNDYSEINPVKREKILRLVKTLRQKCVPVQAVGLQCHWGVDEPAEQQLKTTLQDYTTLSIPLQITELDVSVYPKEHHSRERNATDNDTTFSSIREQQQLAQYQRSFALFRQYKQYITGITFWNLSDRHSWLDNFPVKNRKDYPLLFDRNGQRKAVYKAVTTW